MEGNVNTISNKSKCYFINDSSLDSFGLLMRHYPIPQPCILISDADLTDTDENSCVIGNSIDFLDMIKSTIPLPNLNVDDWLMFPQFGAYTTVLRRLCQKRSNIVRVRITE